MLSGPTRSSRTRWALSGSADRGGRVVAAIKQQTGGSTAGKGTAPTAKAVTFRRSAFEHAELVGQQSVQLGASAVPFRNVVDIPAYGFLRGLWFVLDFTGGAAGGSNAVETAPDGRFAALSLSVGDVSGNPFVGPFPAGFFLSALQKYGGYRFAFDPRVLSPALTVDGNGEVIYYVPLEVIKRSGLGSITNLNAAASYQIAATLSPAATIFSTSPTTLPAVTLRVYMDCWSQPPAQDVLGNLLTRQPPALGTTQFATLQGYAVAGAAYMPIKLTRVGYYLRNLILIFTDASGVRSDGPTPDVLELWKDNQQVFIQPVSLLRAKMYADQGYGITAANLDTAGYQDTGIYLIPFDNDFGLEPGNELRNGYLPTLQSTKLEVRGAFKAACTLYVVTNDVAPPENMPGSIFFPATL